MPVTTKHVTGAAVTTKREHMRASVNRQLGQLLCRAPECGLFWGMQPHTVGIRTAQGTLDPIRCTLCVKPGGSRVLTSGQNQLFPSRGYTAETYAKVMGGSHPSQPRIKPEYTLSFISWIEGAGCFVRCIGLTP